MKNHKIDNIISEPSIARCIFSHLTLDERKNASCVNKTWRRAVKDMRSHCKVYITAELLKKIKDQDINQHIDKNHKYTSDVIIRGWSKGTSLPNSVYDFLFNSSLRQTAKRLSLLGRGTWDTCHCPKEGSTCGEQFDTIKSCDITNLEYINVSTTFTISSCALLDLISRSPKLKILRFYGLLCNPTHNEMFKSKRFLCDLQQVYWPFPKKKQSATLTTLVKRNDNITTLYTNLVTTCDLLSAETLGNLRNLSMNLNESWSSKPGSLKRARKNLEKVNYLSLAKKVEALEIRTYLDEDVFSECKETNQKVGHIFENYKLKFWQQIAKWPTLKYLAVYGAWELEETCREMVKHGLQVEYLKINLLPSSIITASENGEDNLVLAMPDGARNLRKLSCLRSLHFVCFDALATIDTKTTTALKELIDLFWIVDIKAMFTDAVEDFLNSIVKRGNQSGKIYKIHLRIQPKDPQYAPILVETKLKFSLNTSIRSMMQKIAEKELSKRNIRGQCENVSIWGLEQVENCRDKAMYSRLKTGWRRYGDTFSLSSSLT